MPKLVLLCGNQANGADYILPILGYYARKEADSYIGMTPSHLLWDLYSISVSWLQVSVDRSYLELQSIELYVQSCDLQITIYYKCKTSYTISNVSTSSKYFSHFDPRRLIIKMEFVIQYFFNKLVMKNHSKKETKYLVSELSR